MKTLLLITLFSLSLHGQQTNEPNIVYPLLEQFISEAYNRDIPVYHKIREIDSIASKQLKYPLTAIRDHIGGRVHWIYFHNAYINSGRRLEKSFYHEMGHVFKLPYDPESNTIMNSESYSLWFEDNDNWQRAKDEFFKQLKFTQ